MKQYQYQWRALLLMTMAWAFSGLAHNCVSFLFPYFSETFGLGSQHNGYLTATLALFWTISILVCGKKADQLGQVKVMVPGLLAGAAALALLSLSPNVIVMYLLIAVVGFGCGSMCSPSFSFLAEQTMSSFTLIGSAGGSLCLHDWPQALWGGAAAIW